MEPAPWISLRCNNTAGVTKKRSRQIMHDAKKVLKMTETRRRELRKWYATQSEEIIERIHKERSLIFSIWKSRAESTPERKNNLTKERIENAAILAAIATIKKQIEDGKTEKDYKLRVLKAENERKTRKSPQGSLITSQYLELIHKLRSDGLSWRQVQKYIKSYHHKSISHSTLERVYKAEYNSAENPE